ncbi:LPS-assembly lipoprotein LptE [Psychrobacter fozii]|uniref:LPS-assembly lipoprotein LptE n=1 Tax=Psychrobacter fozii TaxID=198480 RepID=UPI001D11D422|nr:LPS assembly lipoprotein LptE [Psychrobacter fozii]
MSYKQQAPSSSKSPIAKKSGGQKLVTALLTALPMFTVLGATAALSGCGFQLRGYDAPMLLDVAKTAVIIEDNRTAFPLKLPLTRRLETLGVDVISNMTAADVALNNKQASADPVSVISVNNLRFRQYELVGVLTEIRLIISADVSYQTTENGKPVTLSNPIQIERSYQYNDASVSTDDQQGDQIREWLYDSLARRITDQYVAISLPKVPSTGTKTPVKIGNGSASTAVVVPTP